MKLRAFICGCVAFPRNFHGEDPEAPPQAACFPETGCSKLEPTNSHESECVRQLSSVPLDKRVSNSSRKSKLRSTPDYQYSLSHIPASSSSRALVGGVEYNSFFVNPLAEGSHDGGPPIAYAGAAVPKTDGVIPNPLAVEFSIDYRTPPESPRSPSAVADTLVLCNKGRDAARSTDPDIPRQWPNDAASVPPTISHSQWQPEDAHSAAFRDSADTPQSHQPAAVKTGMRTAQSEPCAPCTPPLGTREAASPAAPSPCHGLPALAAALTVNNKEDQCDEVPRVKRHSAQGETLVNSTFSGGVPAVSRAGRRCTTSHISLEEESGRRLADALWQAQLTGTGSVTAATGRCGDDFVAAPLALTYGGAPLTAPDRVGAQADTTPTDKKTDAHCCSASGTECSDGIAPRADLLAPPEVPVITFEPIPPRLGSTYHLPANVDGNGGPLLAASGLTEPATVPRSRQTRAVTCPCSGPCTCAWLATGAAAITLTPTATRGASVGGTAGHPVSGATPAAAAEVAVTELGFSGATPCDPGCSISGLAMTRDLIRRLGLLPVSPEPVGQISVPVKAVKQAGAHVAAPSKAYNAVVLALFGSGDGSGEPGPLEELPPSPFASARDAAQRALHWPSLMAAAVPSTVNQTAQCVGREGDGRTEGMTAPGCNGQGVGTVAPEQYIMQQKQQGKCGGVEEVGADGWHDASVRESYSSGSSTSSGGGENEPPVSRRSRDVWLQPQIWKPLRERFGAVKVAA